MNTLQNSEKHAWSSSTGALKYLLLLLATAGLQTQILRAQLVFDGPRWDLRFDMGGTIPQDTRLTQFEPPVSGGYLKLSPGFQMDFTLDYKITPWLTVGPELGFQFNEVVSVGNFRYHDTVFTQMPLMANVTFKLPLRCPLVPYIGAGIGGVGSFLTFGQDYYWGPDGSGSDFTLGFQAFAGLDYRFNNSCSLGVKYRFLYTDSPNWDVEWWDDYHFRVGVDSVQTHSLCLVFSASF